MFGSKSLLFGALLVAIGAEASSFLDDRACDATRVHIVNQTDIDFYSKCSNITGFQFFISHEFKGPFELPNVESVPGVSSGYFLPKLKNSDRVDDGVTSASMPDLKHITQGGLTGGMFFGYVENLTSISFPKLETITGDLVIIGSNKIRNVTLPALETVDGGILLDGWFDEVSLPSLRNVSFIRVEASRNVSCSALGAAFSSLIFTPKKLDIYKGFTCWTPDENNRWNSSDPQHNPTSTGSGPSSTTGTTSGSTTTPNAASAPRVGYGAVLLFLTCAISLYI